MLEFLSSIGSALGGGLSSAGDLFGSALGSKVGGAILSGGSNTLLNSLLGDWSSRRSQSASKKLAYEMSYFNHALDWKYAQKYNQLNYDTTLKMLENSAKSQVKGLRAAGLNPILAASNLGSSGSGGFSSSPASTSSGGSLDTSSHMGSNIDIAEALRDLASIDVSTSSARNLDSQSSLNKTNEELVKANSAKVQAEIDAINTKSDIEVLDAITRAERGGSSGLFGDFRQEVMNAHKESLETKENILRGISRRRGVLYEPTRSSAKDNPDLRDKKASDQISVPSAKVRQRERVPIRMIREMHQLPPPKKSSRKHN